MNSSVPSPPCSVVKRCNLGSLSDFQLCEGGGGANRPSVSTILSEVVGRRSKLARSNYQSSDLRPSDNQTTKQNLA